MMHENEIVENGTTLLLTLWCFITLSVISLMAACLFQTKFLAFIFIVISFITIFYAWIFNLYVKQAKQTLKGKESEK